MDLTDLAAAIEGLADANLRVYGKVACRYGADTSRDEPERAFWHMLGCALFDELDRRREVLEAIRFDLEVGAGCLADDPDAAEDLRQWLDGGPPQ